MAQKDTADDAAASKARQLGLTALIASVASILYLPVGAIIFAGVAIAAWRLQLPAPIRAAYTVVALILLVLLTFVLPVTFEAGPVTIT